MVVGRKVCLIVFGELVVFIFLARYRVCRFLVLPRSFMWRAFVVFLLGLFCLFV